MHPKKKVLVIGAGPAGLTAALKLCETGNFEVTIIEAGSSPGGMSRSYDLWQRKVDLGPHRFFSKRADVTGLWNQMAGNDVHLIKRKTSILFNNRLIDYPLSAASLLTALSPVKLLLSAGSYVSSQLKSKNPEFTFEDVIINRFGNYLYQLFFKSYTEKVWGVKCNELDSTFALQRIKDFSLTAAVAHIFNGLLNSAESRHKTLLTHFSYPKNGAGSVYVNMADQIQKLGGKILFNCKVAKLNFDKSLFVSAELNEGSSICADICISTMPITHLLESSFPNERELLQQTREKLRFRNTILVYLRTAGRSAFQEQWIYINESHLRIGRITNFNNWQKQTYENTVLCLEMWCDSQDSLWMMPDIELSALASKELLSLAFFKDLNVTDTYVVRVPNCYPVYMRGYLPVFKSVAAFVSGFDNLICIGRAGGFRYNNQDHSILMGLLAFENIAFKKNHDLWSANLESSYQEEGTWSKERKFETA